MSRKKNQINQLLREQIAELEKLVKLKDDRIRELEAKSVEQIIKQIQVPNPLQVPPHVFIPSIWTVPCQHEYDQPPYQVGDFPGNPRCKKCGQPVFQQVIVTSGFVNHGPLDIASLKNITLCGNQPADPQRLPRA